VAFVLTVDPVRHAREIRRFEAKIVRGPGSSCWLWAAAVGDDGYGSFSIRRPQLDGRGAPAVNPATGRPLMREHVVSAPRYALAVALGVAMGEAEIAEHVVCDEPICVRAHDGLVEGGIGHLSVSTQADNLRTMGLRGRGGGTPGTWLSRGPDRAARTARSRALRDAVKVHGWDLERMSEAVAALSAPEQARLF
jgi:hypothetical protein